jgi:hypothetical protein
MYITSGRISYTLLYPISYPIFLIIITGPVAPRRPAAGAGLAALRQAAMHSRMRRSRYRRATVGVTVEFQVQVKFNTAARVFRCFFFPERPRRPWPLSPAGRFRVTPSYSRSCHDDSDAVPDLITIVLVNHAPVARPPAGRPAESDGRVTQPGAPTGSVPVTGWHGVGPWVTPVTGQEPVAGPGSVVGRQTGSVCCGFIAGPTNHPMIDFFVSGRFTPSHCIRSRWPTMMVGSIFASKCSIHHRGIQHITVIHHEVVMHRLYDPILWHTF